MKIILTVNFTNEKFNCDFQLSNALLERHTVLLVTNENQLNSAINDYDILLIGQSSFEIDLSLCNKNVIHALPNNDHTISEIDKLDIGK